MAERSLPGCTCSAILAYLEFNFSILGVIPIYRPFFGGFFLMNSPLQNIFFRLSQTASIFVGCVLFIIGLTSSMGVVLQPISELSFLTTPTDMAPKYDQLYWNTLTLVGIWLVIFVYVRLAAIAAIALISVKFSFLNGWLPL